ncbi:MAG: TetM/TetW/TetO/TetS family tetracycline resistance ribosomal protection protein [Oscillospiraceae bacterium]|nr:TetM/TetW/TetO/TetS family tetracycline resistance ribosomal protection protein [Oscillospiraceae bacterium]
MDNSANSIKNKIVLGVLAHVDSGKTTLTEALMYCSGNISKLGRVDHGDSFLDTDLIERSRGITVFSKQAVMKYESTCFTLLDTPGHVDFSAEAERTLQVLDYAVLVISGTAGIQSHTKTLWKLLKKYSVPCFVFINKTDLAGFQKESVLASLSEQLSEGFVDFSSQNSEEFFENIAVCDDKLLNSYYENGTITPQEIRLAIKERKIFPCCFGSALKLTGIEEFLKTLCCYTEMPVYGGEFAAKVFKISEDKQGKRLTFLKVTGGSLQVKDVIKSEKNVSSEKAEQIRIYSGEKFTSANEAPAGTVCAVTGINFVSPGDGLGAEKNTASPVLKSVLTYKVELPEGVDSHFALEKLRILENEDPQLGVQWDPLSGEIRVRLMGEMQLEILEGVIERRFGFKVTFGKGSIIYKETIKNTAEGVGHFEPLRHYAEVHLILKPLKQNSGLVFKSSCREDQLDKNWQRLILTHLYEKTHLGVLTGSPITDMEILLVSGRSHPKHTEGGDFRQATYRAVRHGLRKAESVLLEPIYDFVLEVPSENIGRAISDIERMNGSFESPVTAGEFTSVSGRAPVSEMDGYTKELLQYTRGRGSLSCVFGGYEPCHNADEVIKKIGYDPDLDPENPCGSVFCSHGAGFNVKWDEVESHMHLPLNSQNKNAGVYERSEPFKAYSRGGDIFALDKELMRIFEQTYGPVKERKDPYNIHTPSISGKNKSEKLVSLSEPKYLGKEYLLVDGYNVIYSWNSLKKVSEGSMADARDRLINILCNFQGYKKCEVILVFDAYKVKGENREVEAVGGISVVYTKEAETADTYIEKTSHELAKDHRVRVVTSDGMEQIIILGNGALRVSSDAFLEEVNAAQEEIRKIIAGEPI